MLLRGVSYTIAVMREMEDIREMVKRTNLQDSDSIAETKERIREIITAKADYVRDLARICEQNAEVMLSALQHNDFATAGRMCDIVVREANNLITKGVDLRRDIEEAGHFWEAF